MKILPLPFAALFVPAALCALPLSAQTPRGWHSYKNTDYGFAIAYPPSMKPLEIGRGENSGGSAPACSDSAIACFGYTGRQYQGTNFEAASIAIDLLRGAASEKQCSTLGSRQSPGPASRTELIHGIRFHLGDASEAGMSHRQKITVYRTLYRGVCFAIATQIDTVSLGAFDPGAIQEFRPAKLGALLAQIIHTFRFIGPVREADDWKQAGFGACDSAVYEYPADASSQITAGDDRRSSPSDQIGCSSSFTYRDRMYTLDVKTGHVDDAWLKSQGYPPLADARSVKKSSRYIDYQAGSYYYVYSPDRIYIFSISNSLQRALDPGNDPVYRRWIASFKVLN